MVNVKLSEARLNYVNQTMSNPICGMIHAAVRNVHYTVYGWDHLLCGNFGGLSLTSVRVMLTVVDPDSPPTEPAMSLAWITTV